MNQKKYFILALILSICSTSFSQKARYTVNEEKEINLFNHFKNYIVSSINKKTDFTDSAHFEYMLQNFFFINLKADSLNRGPINLNEINCEKLLFLKKSVSDLFNYFINNRKEKLAENISAIPMRISKDTFIFNRFNKFQKENSLVFFDKRHPEKTIGYLLFIPAIKNINPQTKLWSWSLGFKFGKFYFTSLTGEEGYEYMFGD